MGFYSDWNCWATQLFDHLQRSNYPIPIQMSLAVTYLRKFIQYLNAYCASKYQDFLGSLNAWVRNGRLFRTECIYQHVCIDEDLIAHEFLRD